WGQDDGTRRGEAVMRCHKWAVLALVAVGTFMTALDASIVNIGLPSIARTFRAPVDGAVEWVIIVYLVVIAGALLTFGRLSDLVGRKPVWMTGLALFTLGSALCGAASSLLMLVVTRAFQGLGGALIFAPGLAVVPVEQRVRRPIVDLALLRQPVLASSLGSMMLAMLALFAVSFVLPFYFEELRGFSVARAGFLLTPLPLTIAVVAPFSGALADRIGSRWLAAGGLALASAGLLLLTRLDPHSTIEQIVGCLVLIGLG